MRKKLSTIKITKASGQIEDFRQEKLKSSLRRSGADEEIAEEIMDRVLRDLRPFMSTKEIYRRAHTYLKRLNHASGLRYSLKRALFRLGPSGYPFERYFGELLRNYGYQVDVGVIIEGKCVKHEIDVFAMKDDEVIVAECKYHNRTGRPTDVKVAMYVHSRILDLKPVMASQYPEKTYAGWLVTNTRCTTDAIQFAACSGFRVVSWRYPQKGSLESMIEDERLYPVTIVSGIQSGLVKKLIEQDIILLKDLVSLNVKDLQSRLGLPERKARSLKRQAEELCLCEE
jgi:Holliday junction resolvase